ncbi:MAG: aminomethyl-transferring glycine dehydrogenase [Rhodobacteraceae bacterium]|nr:aminomethyl-transferring glycine dehydrogenase [Paracoccaceae bacterium]MCY4197159.1 aminomethyl-transferring glycine dehydrogenase [Paracoccaceae bacterium]
MVSRNTGSLTQDYNPEDFANLRHIGPSRPGVARMLQEMGYASEQELVDRALPDFIRCSGIGKLGSPVTESEALDLAAHLAARNRQMISLIGMGYYRSVTPPVIQRNILENPAWYTAYTPYQPEISQGRLEVLLDFQTMICDLTGLQVANASLLDEATAGAEAMAMARRVSKSRSNRFFVDQNCHPQTIAVIRTRGQSYGFDLVIGCPETDMKADDLFGALFQYPGTYGDVRDLTPVISSLHEMNAVAAVAADPMALAILREPGAMGADIAVGSTQRFGLPLGFGGPHAAYIATRDQFRRELPGRIVGISRDSKGREAYRLALQTREQHIRRQKAKSNICTAQVLPAVMAGLYAVFHGPQGIRAIAERIHFQTVALRDTLVDAGFKISTSVFFDTLMVQVNDRQQEILETAVAAGINLRKIGDDRIGLSLDELIDFQQLSAVAHSFGAASDFSNITAETTIPDSLRRRSAYLTHPTFHQNRAETAMVRYMRRLADKDLALDRTMIPLGSCTMKLNATAEMSPVTLPGFAQIHPYAPSDQVEGYAELIRELSEKLCEITGFDAISMQPNSGAQGEYAGLLAIHRYHTRNGAEQRRVCLIPASAHGTNAASAQMAGMQVVEVRTMDDGTIDLHDLHGRAVEAGDCLAATMITYPSTHGVFEDTIRDVIAITHEFGGQVYCDGANLNALVGIAKLGDLGADVAHLNLHKTFCIPHGGGGPGMGPIGVRSHLAPFLPGDPSRGEMNGAVSATPYGSASILPVSWIYILLMGGEGLTRATRMAIVNANYIAHRLKGRFDICFSGRGGLVAHECIIDIGKAVAGTSITVEDVAKRLIDCGFHPPTMSWPVAGTLMVEPTESEPEQELDRFCEAMLGIMDEIDAVREGRVSPDNNPMVNAPHSLEDLVEDWSRPYRRSRAFFPPGCLRESKYWPPVNRVDNVWGDRNFVGVRPNPES